MRGIHSLPDHYLRTGFACALLFVLCACDDPRRPTDAAFPSDASARDAGAADAAAAGDASAEHDSGEGEPSCEPGDFVTCAPWLENRLCGNEWRSFYCVDGHHECPAGYREASDPLCRNPAGCPELGGVDTHGEACEVFEARPCKYPASIDCSFTRTAVCDCVGGTFSCRCAHE
jgi:hypothetical protein